MKSRQNDTDSDSKYEITIETAHQEYVLSVSEAKFLKHNIKFTGFDPSDCPEELKDYFQFYSKDLSAMLTDASELEHISIGVGEEL